MIIEDNRNIIGVRVDPNECNVGDLYKPWYFYKNPVTGCPKDIEQVCLIYKVERASLCPHQIVSTSFLKVPSVDDRDEHLDLELTTSIKEEGQREDIICTSHYTLDSPIRIELLEDPELEKVKCFEGHHRKVSCEELGIPVNAQVYHLYHMNTPINWSKHYHSLYDDSFWAPFQTSQTKQPWFTKASFLDGKETKKYEYLSKCFEFIKHMNIECSTGVDVGCAEGAYTVLASKELDCKMLGVDSEAGRIIRGLLVKAEHGMDNLNFCVSSWHDATYSAYDFGMALSILHHMDTGEDKEFLRRLCENKKALIVEVRIRDNFTPIEQGSMKGINTQSYYEQMFTELDMKYQHIITSNPDGPRAFYVLYR